MSCDTFGAAFAEAYASENIQTYLSERYSDLLEILAKNANVSSYISGISIYDVLKVQVSDLVNKLNIIIYQVKFLGRFRV